MWDTKHRPLTFADVLGQKGSIKLLKARLRNGTALETNYIFSGGFGQGKTTLARVHARAMLCQQLNLDDPEPCNVCDNCQAILEENSMAFMELDAASRGTIDNIRGIVDDLPFAVYGAAKRLYLFDEAHRMGIGAQDVLLKPLEEKRMVGLFCTTEPEKIRGPIRSRCEHYAIGKVTREDILARMNKILDAEGVMHDDDSVLTVIDYSGGHVRDVLNRLEMISQMGAINIETVREYLRLRVVNLYYKVLLALGDPKQSIELVEQICEQVTPEEATAGLAEAAMNSFRLAHNMLPDFTTADRALGQQVHERFGVGCIKLAEFFLRNRYITQVGLLSDVLTLVSGLPQAPSRTMSAPPVVVMAAPVQAPAVPAPVAPVAPVAAAQESVLPPIKVNGNPLPGGFLRETHPLGPTDAQIKNEPGNRRKQEKRDNINLTAATEDLETRPLHPEEWRRVFEQNWNERHPGGKV